MKIRSIHAFAIASDLVGGPARTPARINEHLAPLLVDEPCDDIDHLWKMMQGMTSPYAGGLASYAISAIDLALWDLKGKHQRAPVYDLLGGPARTRVSAYGRLLIEFEIAVELGADLPLPEGTCSREQAGVMLAKQARIANVSTI